MTLLEFIHDIPALRDEAKALWGEGEYINGYSVTGKVWDDYPKTPNYLYYLEQMLKSDNPVEYYEQHKPKGKL